MTPLEHLQQKLRDGDLVILDGGTGTELQARGVRMDSHAWSAIANLETPEVVQAVHEDYIRAGADVVITNTYAAARPPLAAAGLDDRVQHVNRAGVTAAHGARERAGVSEVVIAGSMSHVQMGAATEHWPTDESALRDVFREQANVLAEAGVDVLTIEMITERRWSAAARDAAVETGLPVWLGFACEASTADGRTPLRGNQAEDLRAVSEELVDDRVSAVFVMHTDLQAVLPALLTLTPFMTRLPVGVYPNIGTFSSPNWVFDVSDISAFLESARTWASHGASLIGGCCGTRPDHIRQLRGLLFPPDSR